MGIDAPSWRFRCGTAAPLVAGALVDRLLTLRGVDLKDRASFLRPELKQLMDFDKLPGAQDVARRLLAAVKRGERIAIHGDYDADGVCAAALMWHALKEIDPKARLQLFIPHREFEGFGIAPRTVSKLHAEGVGVIVTVDCGASGIEAAKVASKCGIELLVTDHHEPSVDARGEPQWPTAAAIAHPLLAVRVPSDGQPRSAPAESEMSQGGGEPLPSGTGVAWMVALALAREAAGAGATTSPGMRDLLVQLLGLVAIGTIADMMELRGPNRALVACGLRTLSSTRLTGLRALMQAQSPRSGTVFCQYISWNLAPTINASGRMDHALPMAQLLSAPLSDKGVSPSKELISMAVQAVQDNTIRKERTESLQSEADQRMRSSGLLDASGRVNPGFGAIVLSDPQWQLGILGLACGRLVEKTGLPAVLLTESDSEAGTVLRGSCRGSAEYSILEGLHACHDLLISYGGHPAAAGLTVESSKFAEFRERLNAHALAATAGRSEAGGDANTQLGKVADLTATLSEVADLAQVKSLEQLSPFGKGNPLPVLLLRNLVVDSVDVMGARDTHLRLSVRDGCGQKAGLAPIRAGEAPDLGKAPNPNGASNTGILKCVWFGAGTRAHEFQRGSVIDLLASASINSFGGKDSPQLQIVDARISKSSGS